MVLASIFDGIDVGEWVGDGVMAIWAVFSLISVMFAKQANDRSKRMLELKRYKWVIEPINRELMILRNNGIDDAKNVSISSYGLDVEFTAHIEEAIENMHSGQGATFTCYDKSEDNLDNNILIEWTDDMTGERRTWLEPVPIDVASRREAGRLVAPKPKQKHTKRETPRQAHRG